ncbi:MAG: YceI family protein [Rhodospirillaceae bacterium]
MLGCFRPLRVLGFALGLVVASGLAPGFAPSSAWAQTQWVLDPGASALTFQGTQMGAAFEGSFSSFQADISFDPDAPEAAVVEVVIDMASASTGSQDRDAQIGTAVWFDVATHPTATFSAQNFQPQGDGRFLAEAALTIKGQTAQVPFPFTLTLSGAGADRRAVAAGEIVVDRTVFQVGTGEWAADAVVGRDVTIAMAVEASAVPGS